MYFYMYFLILNLSVTVGATALPTILKMATIMKEKKNEWSQQDELPVSYQMSETNFPRFNIRFLKINRIFL